MDYMKKIVYHSNYWYNDGLRKAQMRDMSGAIASLRRSLQFNRENIAARNLLGLVYYGIGEVPEALVEWIISKNLKQGIISRITISKMYRLLQKNLRRSTLRSGNITNVWHTASRTGKTWRSSSSSRLYPPIRLF